MSHKKNFKAKAYNNMIKYYAQSFLVRHHFFISFLKFEEKSSLYLHSGIYKSVMISNHAQFGQLK